jgi:hypothetical protein
MATTDTEKVGLIEDTYPGVQRPGWKYTAIQGSLGAHLSDELVQGSNRSLLWRGGLDLKPKFTTAKFCLWVEDSSVLGGNSLVVDGLVHLNFVAGSLCWIRPLVEGNITSGTTLNCHLAWFFGNSLVWGPYTMHYILEHILEHIWHISPTVTEFF